MIVSRTSCLKHCSRGITLAVYPDNVWYAGVRPEDLEEIVFRTSRRTAGGEAGHARHPVGVTGLSLAQGEPPRQRRVHPDQLPEEVGHVDLPVAQELVDLASKLGDDLAAAGRLLVDHGPLVETPSPISFLTSVTRDGLQSR